MLATFLFILMATNAVAWVLLVVSFIKLRNVRVNENSFFDGSIQILFGPTFDMNSRERRYRRIAKCVLLYFLVTFLPLTFYVLFNGTIVLDI